MHARYDPPDAGFIDARTRLHVRLALAGIFLVALLSRFMLGLGLGPAEPDPDLDPVQYKSVIPRGQVIYSERRAEVASNTPSPPPEPPVTMEVPPPDAPADHDLEQLLEMLAPRPRQVETSEPPPVEVQQQVAAEQVPEQLPEQLPEPAETPGLPIPDAMAGTADSLDGETAPPYRLASLDQYLLMVRRHGGLLVAHDGRLTVLVGRSLDPAEATPRLIRRGDLPGYASRMSGLPLRHADVLRLQQWLLREFPQLDRRALIMLALPERHDAVILAAQRADYERTGAGPPGGVTTGRFVDIGGSLRFDILALDDRP